MQPTEKYYEHDAYRREGGGAYFSRRAGQPDRRRAHRAGRHGVLPRGRRPACRPGHPDPCRRHGADRHRCPRAGGCHLAHGHFPAAGAVPGAEAAQAIDWAWRFDKMQQHTGEHILSGILHSMFGAENVGFHIGSEAVRMDTSVPISAEGLQAAEFAANRIVWQDVPVLISYPTQEELAALFTATKKRSRGRCAS